MMGHMPAWSDMHEGAAILGDISAQRQRPALMFHSAPEPIDPLTGLPTAHGNPDAARSHSIGMTSELGPLGHMHGITHFSDSRQRSRSVRSSPTSVHGYPVGLGPGSHSTRSSPIDPGPMGIPDHSLGQLPRSHSFHGSYSDAQHHFLSAHGHLHNPLSVHSSEAIIHSGGNSPVAGSSEWLSSQSPSNSSIQMSLLSPHSAPRYMIVEMIRPWLINVVPVAIACDLLEHYFIGPRSALSSSSQDFAGSIFRKNTVLHASRPRKCTPALLFSMLCIASLSCPSAYLASSPRGRSRICKMLFDRTKALVQQSNNHITL